MKMEKQTQLCYFGDFGAERCQGLLMDRIWEEGENSQGRSLKLWLEQLGGEDHLLRRKKVNPAYLLSPTVTDPASRRESCCEAGKTVCRSQPWAQRGHTGPSSIFGKKAGCSCVSETTHFLLYTQHFQHLDICHPFGESGADSI